MFGSKSKYEMLMIRVVEILHLEKGQYLMEATDRVRNRHKNVSAFRTPRSVAQSDVRLACDVSTMLTWRADRDVTEEFGFRDE